jgi:hypothetical protein
VARKHLSDAQVLAIRKRLAEGRTQRAVATEFDVHVNSVGMIARGETYVGRTRAQYDQPIGPRLPTEPEVRFAERALARQRELVRVGGSLVPPGPSCWRVRGGAG